MNHPSVTELSIDDRTLSMLKSSTPLPHLLYVESRWYADDCSLNKLLTRMPALRSISLKALRFGATSEVDVAAVFKRCCPDLHTLKANLCLFKANVHAGLSPRLLLLPHLTDLSLSHLPYSDEFVQALAANSTLRSLSVWCDTAVLVKEWTGEQHAALMKSARAHPALLLLNVRVTAIKGPQAYGQLLRAAAVGVNVLGDRSDEFEPIEAVLNRNQVCVLWCVCID